MKKIILIVSGIFATFVVCCSSANYSKNAKQILDASQGKAPEGFSAKGHPRGHVKGKDTHRFSIESLQDYSRDQRGPTKTGFKSRADQERVVNLALKHRLCQNGIAQLNRGSLREKCVVPAAYTVHNLQIEEWRNGKFHHEGIMRQIVIVMGHFRGQQNNPRANVHIQTAYPTF